MKKPALHRSKPKNEYQSWDPFTQAKFLFDIHQQTGTPITRAQAYRCAVLAVYGPDDADVGQSPR